MKTQQPKVLKSLIRTPKKKGNMKHRIKHKVFSSSVSGSNERLTPFMGLVCAPAQSQISVSHRIVANDLNCVRSDFIGMAEGKFRGILLLFDIWLL